MTPKTKMDHLFRHQYGKMVSILTRIFGLSNLELIEDAVQDTFLKAGLKWRNKIPENPEAWLTAVAKNRVIDLLRKLKTEKVNLENLNYGVSAITINKLFLEDEIEDSQLRMIFTACHPYLKPQDQIAFALKTIAGFSRKEIASALLLDPETVKKRLQRARKTIKDKNIHFNLPSSKHQEKRLNSVHQVIYLLFNEGFHSTKKDILIRQDLCGEAIRLCKLLLRKNKFRTGSGYGLFALLCFHTARIESKIDLEGNIVDLKNQDRTLWHQPLIELGKDALKKSAEFTEISSFQIEASIALEHVISKSFKETNWKKILKYYQMLQNFSDSDYILLNQAIVLIQLKEPQRTFDLLGKINPKRLEQRSYLYYGALAECYLLDNNFNEALKQLDLALQLVQNSGEQKYLEEKKLNLKKRIYF